MPKPPSKTAAGARRDVAAEAEALARQLADRPYGQEKKVDDLVRTSFTLPKALLTELEDEALANKRSGREPKSVSAIIREALEQRKSIK